MDREQKKWYPVEYREHWEIHMDHDIDPTNVLDKDWVGKEAAAKNALLCSKAPEMKEMLDEMISELYNAAMIPGYDNPKSYYELKDKYEQLCKDIKQ